MRETLTLSCTGDISQSVLRNGLALQGVVHCFLDPQLSSYIYKKSCFTCYGRNASLAHIAKVVSEWQNLDLTLESIYDVMYMRTLHSHPSSH